MAIFELEFRAKNEQSLTKPLEQIVTLSKAAQDEVDRLADTFGISANQAKDLVDQFNRLTRQGASNLQVFEALNKEFGISFKQFSTLANVSKTTSKEINFLSNQFLKARRDVNRMSKQTRTGSKNVKELGDSAKTASRGVNTLGVAVGNFASQATFELIRRISQAVQDIGRASIDAALEVERLIRTFDFTTEGAGAETLETLREAADRLGISLRATGREFGQLSAAAFTAGISLEQQLELFEGVNKAGIQLGASNDQLSRAFRALQQVISKGRVSQEEIRQQLAEAIPGSVNLAAEALGALTTEFEELVAEGLPAAEFIPRFADVLNRTFVGAAESSQASLARFENAIFDLQIAIGQELLPVAVEFAELITDLLRDGGIERLRELTRELVLTFEGLVVIGSQVVELFQTLRQRQAFPALDLLINSLSNIQQLLAAIGDISRTNRQIAEDIAEATEGVAKATEAVTEAIEEGTQSYKEQLEAQQELKKEEKEREKEEKKRNQDRIRFFREDLAEAQRNAAERQQDLDKENFEREKELIEEAAQARIDAIEAQSQEAENALNRELELRQEAIEKEFEARQKAEQKALNDNLKSRFTAIQEELRIRDGETRSQIEREKKERERILQLGREVITDERDVRFLSVEDLKAILEVEDELRREQQQILKEQQERDQEELNRTQEQERLATEAVIKTQRFLDERAIAEEKGRLEQQLRDDEAAFRDDQRKKDLENAEKIKDILRTALFDVEDRFGPAPPVIPRFTGGPVSPGNVYLGGEQGMETLNLAGKQYPIGANGPELFTVPKHGTIDNHQETMAALNTVPSGNTAAPASRVEKKLDTLIKVVKERPSTSVETTNHFHNEPDPVNTQIKLLRADLRNRSGRF